MGGIRHVNRWSGRRRSPDVVEHADWGERTDRPRVLIENPDGAELWAHSEILREAGYDVAICAGPPQKTPQRGRLGRRPLHSDEFMPILEHAKPVACPLLAHGRCALVEGADVVVSTTDLHQSRGILAALARRRSPGLVVEGPPHLLEQDRDVIGDNSTVIEYPVTEGRLLTAVTDALAQRQ